MGVTNKTDWVTFEAIAKEKQLSQVEEVILLNEIRKGNRQAIDKIVHSWEGVILSIAKQYSNGTVAIEELVEAGRKELIKLGEQEIGNTGRERFSRFGAWCVKQGILLINENKSEKSYNDRIFKL